MGKLKTAFVCQHCGMTATKWLGRCPDCESWNSFVEELPAPEPSSSGRRSASGLSGQGKATPYPEVALDSAIRVTSGLDEFDRVLGGGIVQGSLVLLGGDPGIGKSTLLLQVAAFAAARGTRVVYVSGEESERQIKLRGERLNVQGDDLLLFAETSLDHVLQELNRTSPGLVVLDSVQTLYSPRFSSAPGSISQVREVTAAVLEYAKSTSTPVFLIGHVTKEGHLAGPKALEHMVDTVLYFEGERHHAHRVVRAVKNRFGAAGELGVFEMSGAGLLPIENPSGLFLSDRDTTSPGSAVVCSLEGTRPMLLEIQSLVATSALSYPRRVAVGFDSNRLSLLLAVLEKHIKMPLGTHDVYVNVAGGLSVTEPVADLGVVGAIASSLRNQSLAKRTAFVGEVGLSGEVRSAQQLGLRVKEMTRMGFQTAYVPEANLPLDEAPGELELAGISDVSALMESIF